MSLATYQHGVLTWTGDGAASNAQTGLGFQPTDVIVKRITSGSTALGGCFVTLEHTVGESTPIGSPGGADLTDGVLSMDSDGITLGAGDEANGSGGTYVALCLRRGSGHFFRAGSYVGNATDDQSQVIAGSDFTPDFLMLLGVGGSGQGVYRSRSHAGDQSVMMMNDTTVANLIQAFTATGFQVGDDDEVNENGVTFYYFAWRRYTSALDAVVGSSSYIGDGGGTRSISGVGFQPAWMHNNTDASGTGTFWRHTANSGNVCSAWSTPGETAALFLRAFEADGFEVGSNLNANTVVYHYLCLAATASLSVRLTETAAPTADDAIAGDSILLTWGEFTDADATVQVQADRDLPDDADYYGGFKDARVASWEPIRRSLSDREGRGAGVQFGWTMNDQDFKWRTLLAASTTRFFRGRPGVVRTISDAGRRAKLGALTLAQGSCSEYGALPHKQFFLRFRDRYTHEFGPRSGVRLPRRRVRLDEFDDCPEENLDKPEPIVCGALNDLTTNIDTPVAAPTGFTATKVAQATAAPTGFTATPLAGGTSGEALTRYYILEGVDASGSATVQTAVASATTTFANQSIRLSWDTFAGVTGWRLFSSHNPNFRQFSYRTFAAGTLQFDDVDIPWTEERLHLNETGWLLGVRLNLTYYLHALLSDGTFSQPALVSLDFTPIFHAASDQDRHVSLSWDAHGTGVGYRLSRQTSWYSRWRERVTDQQDLDVGATSYTDELTNADDTVRGTIPGNVGTTTTARLNGVVPVLDVGTELVSGVRHTRLLIAGHACKGVDAIFISRADASAAASEEASDEMVFDQVPTSDYGTTWLVPGESGWPHPNTYVDINGRRYFYLLTTLDPLPKNILVNVRGIEETGDGTGALVTDLIRQMELVLEQFVEQDYQTGNWTSAPTFAHDTALTKLDGDAFDAAVTVWQSRHADGFEGAWAIGVTGEFWSVEDWMAAMCISCDMEWGLNAKMQVMVSVFESQPVSTTPAFDHIVDMLEDSFHVEELTREMVNVWPCEYRFNYLDRRYEVAVEARDADSITNHGEEAVGPTMRLFAVRSAAIAETVYTWRVKRYRDPPRVVEFRTRMQGTALDLGDICRITTPDGIGASGYSAVPIRVMGMALNPVSSEVTITGEDVKRLIRDGFILGDETVIAATWASASEDDRYYGYLGDEASETFTSDGEPIKRLMNG
jgi:hypothetical protein